MLNYVKSIALLKCQNGSNMFSFPYLITFRFILFNRDVRKDFNKNLMNFEKFLHTFDLQVYELLNIVNRSQISEVSVIKLLYNYLFSKGWMSMTDRNLSSSSSSVYPFRTWYHEVAAQQFHKTQINCYMDKFFT